MKFLEAIQQFASIGDVVVGGSQNIIACGVWSLVRLTLLSVVTASSNLEKLTGFFMTVGGSAPRYQNMAVLYPQSAPLQSHLCEYYIVMVRICHKLIKTLKTPIRRQMGSFLSASEMSGFQSDLDRWSTSIKDEVYILTAQSINKQRADLRQISRNWAQEQRRRKLTDYHRLLDLCSTYDHQTPWKQLRKIGSTNLFNSLTTYRDWKAASQRSFFNACLHGQTRLRQVGVASQYR
ncbi:hypothetical protein PHISP_00101 [Aspergillus sp. HF37]|nr:hypothetical protein PHISP_00101 [Aspergillus sp. HF37]